MQIWIGRTWDDQIRWTSLRHQSRPNLEKWSTFRGKWQNKPLVVSINWSPCRDQSCYRGRSWARRGILKHTLWLLEALRTTQSRFWRRPKNHEKSDLEDVMILLRENCKKQLFYLKSYNKCIRKYNVAYSWKLIFICRNSRNMNFIFKICLLEKITSNDPRFANMILTYSKRCILYFFDAAQQLPPKSQLLAISVRTRRCQVLAVFIQSQKRPKPLSIIYLFPRIFFHQTKI